MNCADIINQAEQDGVALALSEKGNVKAIGKPGAVERWKEIIRAHKLGIIATLRGTDLPKPEIDGRHFRWMISFPGNPPVETTCLPEPTHAEVLALYPTATAAEPIPESPRRPVTPRQESDLQALVSAVGEAYSLTPAEQGEVLDLALADPESALRSYRAMAVEQGVDMIVW
jgi:hypothetical protein